MTAPRLFLVANARMPVVKHYKGVCHVYVDDDADLEMAQEICFNAKVQRPGVCNSMETLLVHQAAAETFLPGMAKRFALEGCHVVITDVARPHADPEYGRGSWEEVLEIYLLKQIHLPFHWKKIQNFLLLLHHLHCFLILHL